MKNVNFHWITAHVCLSKADRPIISHIIIITKIVNLNTRTQLNSIKFALFHAIPDLYRLNCLPRVHRRSPNPSSPQVSVHTDHFADFSVYRR